MTPVGEPEAVFTNDLSWALWATHLRPPPATLMGDDVEEASIFVQGLDHGFESQDAEFL